MSAGPNRWPLQSLGDFIEVKHGFAFEGHYFVSDGPYRLLTPGNFAEAGGFVDRGPSQKHYDGPVPPDYVLPPGALLVAMTEQAEGLLGSVAIVPFGGKPCLHNQRLGLMRSRPNAAVELRFLYYLFNSPEVRRQLSATATGTKIRHTSPSRIAELSIPIPPLPAQTAIASLLGSLDDKIELNRRMNETLERMAQAIFRDWFVDFGPVRRKLEGATDPVKIMGGVIQNADEAARLAALFPAALADNGLPKGWRHAKIGEFVEILDSQRVPLSSRERDNRKGPFPYYGATGVMDYVDDFLFDDILLLLGEDGSVAKPDGRPYTQYVWDKLWVNNHAHVLRGSGISTEHLKCFFDQLDIAPFVTGAVQPKLNQGNLKSIPFINASSNVCRAFDDIATALFAIIRTRTNENHTLENMRDLLLPKLMSGEVRLSETAAVP